ncbi:transcription antitermination factor NusB [Parvularcula marina]|jgi:transcription antitermination protein NusB|uniref:Transcription antitermination protein NusB n=1 Tax=Parvularcula marina TaxID=2292771 RepID=A0A371RL98_9PROT|nr:transcription antitermination factor NusB [Parvularcula marina]RFB06201.1 transcription antitermination factor NusB [Parvularcula marina]
MSGTTEIRGRAVEARTMARLAAVQALYQMEHSAIGVEAVIREFQSFRLGGEMEGSLLRDADAEFFAETVRGVVENQRGIDPFIQKHLSEGWTLKRLDATARSILRCGIFELIRRPDIPWRATVDEYVEIANSFFDSGQTEPRFINGVLDASAREIRADEVS